MEQIRITFVIHVIVIHGPIDAITVDYTLSILWRLFVFAELMKHFDLPWRFIFIWYHMAILLFTNPTTYKFDREEKTENFRNARRHKVASSVLFQDIWLNYS